LAAATATRGPSAALGARRRDVDTGPQLRRRVRRRPLRGVTAHLGGRLPHQVLRRVVAEPPSQVVVVPMVRFERQASVVVRAVPPLHKPWDAAQLELLLPLLLLLPPLLLMLLLLPPRPSRCHLVVELKLQQSSPCVSCPGKLDWQLRAGREQKRQAVHARELEPEGGQGSVKGRSCGEERDLHDAPRFCNFCRRWSLCSQNIHVPIRRASPCCDGC